MVYVTLILEDHDSTEYGPSLANRSWRSSGRTNKLRMRETVTNSIVVRAEKNIIDRKKKTEWSVCVD